MTHRDKVNDLPISLPLNGLTLTMAPSRRECTSPPTDSGAWTFDLRWPRAEMRVCQGPACALRILSQFHLSYCASPPP